MGVARNDACESLYGQCCFGRLASWQLHMRDRTCRIGKLCSLTACHHQAFAGQLAYCTSLFAFRSTLFAHCCDRHQLLRSVRSSGIVSVCGCNNIAEPVHAASVKLCVTCGHSILCQLAFMCSGCWRLLLPPFLSHCLLSHSGKLVFMDLNLFFQKLMEEEVQSVANQARQQATHAAAAVCQTKAAGELYA